MTKDTRPPTDFLALVGRLAMAVLLLADVDINLLAIPGRWRRRRRVHVRLRRTQGGRGPQVVVVVERAALYGRLGPVRVVVERLGTTAWGWLVRGF